MDHHQRIIRGHAGLGETGRNSGCGGAVDDHLHRRARGSGGGISSVARRSHWFTPSGVAKLARSRDAPSVHPLRPTTYSRRAPAPRSATSAATRAARLKVDREVESRRPQAADQCQVVSSPAYRRGAAPRGPRSGEGCLPRRSGRRLDDIGRCASGNRRRSACTAGVVKATHRLSSEPAGFALDSHSPITNSPTTRFRWWLTISMTGMSSLIGYTRLQVAHFSRCRFDQRDRCCNADRRNFEQFRVNGMSGIMTLPLCEQFRRMKFAASPRVLGVTAGRRRRDPSSGQRPPQPAAVASLTSGGPTTFHAGHRLEKPTMRTGHAAYKRLWSSIRRRRISRANGGLYLRKQDSGRNGTAEQALKVAQANREANRALGTFTPRVGKRGWDVARAGRCRRAMRTSRGDPPLELATDRVTGRRSQRPATLARLYVRMAPTRRRSRS